MNTLKNLWGGTNMNQQREQRYYADLWKIIHQKTNDFNFYRRTDTGAAELDTALLASHIKDSHPKIYSGNISPTVYRIPHTPFSENIALLMLTNSNKGFSIALKDGKGGHKIMVNAGSTSAKNKKRLISFTMDSLDTTSRLRSAIALRILQSDIEYVLEKQHRKRDNKVMAAVLVSVAKNRATPKGSFERHFKALIKEQGPGSTPMAAARYLFNTMPHSEKKKLNRSLYGMGIRTNRDMNRLLQKWEAEVSPAREKVRPSMTKAVSMEYGR
jgi:hypothetical protein